MIDFSKYQDEESGSDDGAQEEFMHLQDKEQDNEGAIPLALQLQMRIQDGILNNSSTTYNNNDTSTDIFDDNSDTENTTNGGNRLKSSNASIWSVEDEEDWGDLEIPSSHSLTWVAKDVNSSKEKLTGVSIAPAAENWEEDDATGARNKSSLLRLLIADDDDEDPDDFEDGLHFGDDDEKLSLKLKPSLNVLCEGLEVEDIDDEIKTTQCNNKHLNIIVDELATKPAQMQLDAFASTPLQNTQNSIDTEKKKPVLITLEMMQKMSFSDFQSKVESPKSITEMKSVTASSSRIRSTSRQSQASVTTTEKVCNINTKSSVDSIFKKNTRKMLSSTSKPTIAPASKNFEKEVPSAAAATKKRPPRNLSRQSSADDMDKKKSAWVSSIKLPPPKPVVSQISAKIADPVLSSSKKSLPLTKGNRSLANSREDVRKPPMMASSSLSDKPQSLLHSGPASNKVFVKRNTTSSTLVKASATVPTIRDPSAKSESTIKQTPSIRPSSSAGAPPERWSSGSSRDMKRPPTHRVAFGRTLKDTPAQPQIKPKLRKQPTLIRHLGNAETPKVVGSMIYDPVAKKWTGNEQSLQIFDKPVRPTIKPTLIPHTPKKEVEQVGGMVFDPVKCVWVGNEEESHLFDEIDAFEKADPTKIAAKMGLVCNKSLRDEWNSAETRHKLFIGSWYPRACDARFIRDSSRVHLWEIKTALLQL